MIKATDINIKNISLRRGDRLTVGRTEKRNKKRKKDSKKRKKDSSKKHKPPEEETN